MSTTLISIHDRHHAEIIELQLEEKESHRNLKILHELELNDLLCRHLGKTDVDKVLDKHLNEYEELLIIYQEKRCILEDRQARELHKLQ